MNNKKIMQMVAEGGGKLVRSLDNFRDFYENKIPSKHLLPS